MKAPVQPPRAIAPTAAALFALACLVVGTAVGGYSASTHRIYAPRAGLACPNDGPVDFSRLVGPTAHWTPQEPDDEHFLRERLRRLEDGAEQRAPVQVWTIGSMAPGQSKFTATRGASGLWTLTQDREGDSSAGHSRITLSSAESEQLDRMLADACLYAEPEIIDNEYPSADGKSGVCFDGANTYVDIDFAGRRRAAVQACETYGLTGKLVNLLREPFFRPNRSAQ